MSTKQMFNVGTTVYYEGDEILDGGFGTVTDQFSDSIGELMMEITLEDGRVLSAITPQDFEPRKVLGNTQSAEFHVVDTGIQVLMDGLG